MNISRNRQEIKKKDLLEFKKGTSGKINFLTGEITKGQELLNKAPLRYETKIKPFTKNNIMAHEHLLKQLGHVYFYYTVALGNQVELGTNRVDPTFLKKNGTLKETAYRLYLAKIRKHDIVRKLKIKFLNDTKKRYYFNPYLAQAGKDLPTELFEEFKNSKHYDKELF